MGNGDEEEEREKEREKKITSTAKQHPLCRKCCWKQQVVSECCKNKSTQSTKKLETEKTEKAPIQQQRQWQKKQTR